MVYYLSRGAIRAARLRIGSKCKPNASRPLVGDCIATVGWLSPPRWAHDIMSRAMRFPRSFLDYGAVYDGERHYFVKAADLEHLQKSVASENRWLLCYGPKGSGKSSLLWQILRDLEGMGFRCVYTDCLIGSMMKDEAAAIGAFARDFLGHRGTYDEGRVQTVDTLLEMMCGVYGEGEKLVWFLDGLDRIEDLSVVKVLLNGLHHNNKRYKLHSLVLSGGSRLKEIVTTTLLPDDDHHLCLLRPMEDLSQESIETMLHEFRQESGDRVEDLDKIARSMFDLTFGHKQSVGTLCYFLYDWCRANRMDHEMINSEAWYRNVGAGRVTGFASVRMIHGDYTRYSEEIQVLLTECLVRGSVLTTDTTSLQKLVDDGLLRRVSTEEDGLRVCACASSALMLSIMHRTLVTGGFTSVDYWTRTDLHLATIAAAILFMGAGCRSQYELECQFLLALKHLDWRSCIAEAVAEGTTSYRLGIVLRVRSMEPCPLQGFVLHLGPDDALAEHLRGANEHAELHDFEMNYINFLADDEGAAKSTKLAVESEAPKWEHVRCWCASYASGRWTIERLDREAGCWITMQKDACHLPECKFVEPYMDWFYSPCSLSEKSKRRLKREREAEAERFEKRRKQEHKNLLIVESEEQPPLLPPLKEDFIGRATLVLDLDFTLVHTMANEEVPSAMETIEFFKHVFKRPGVDEFLRKMAQLYEVVIYSGGRQDYVDRVLEVLDPSKEIFSHRLYRHHTMENFFGSTIKTLDKLGRDMKRVVLVDDDPGVFRDTPLNGLWLKHYVNDGHHDEPNQLEEITAYLTRIAKVADVREGMSRDERFEWNKKQALCSPGCTFKSLLRG